MSHYNRIRTWSGRGRLHTLNRTKCNATVGVTQRQCKRAKGHGPKGRYCKQHAKCIERTSTR